MATVDELPSGLVATVGAEFEPGEKLAWVGQPIPRLYARRSLPAVLFGIPWTIFSLFMCFQMGDGNRSLEWLIPTLAMGIPFVLIGCIMVFSPFWMMRRAKRTAYAVTDRRALMFDAGWFDGHTIRSFQPDQLLDFRRIQRGDGSGDLILDRQWSKDSDGRNQSTDYGFLAIQDPKMVEGLIRELVNAKDAV
jgi:hypothetical protein